MRNNNQIDLFVMPGPVLASTDCYGALVCPRPNYPLSSERCLSCRSLVPREKAFTGPDVVGACYDTDDPCPYPRARRFARRCDTCPKMRS